MLTHKGWIAFAAFMTLIGVWSDSLFLRLLATLLIVLSAVKEWLSDELIAQQREWMRRRGYGS